MHTKMTLEILEHINVGPDVFRLTLSGATGARPGQFVQVGVSSTLDPFLKRPFSVHACTETTLTLLYRKAGRGTAFLAEKQAGESLSVVGPLGNGFPITKQKRVIVVAGGIGAAPLYYLVRSLQSAGKDVTFLYGAKTSAELVCQQEFQALVQAYAVATDDGSQGLHGVVTELVQQALIKQHSVVYACGPEQMLRSVARIANENECVCYVSLEARMACGVGACLGCVVAAADGVYRRVCVDGPVFSAAEVFGT